MFGIVSLAVDVLIVEIVSNSSTNSASTTSTSTSTRSQACSVPHLSLPWVMTVTRNLLARSICGVQSTASVALVVVVLLGIPLALVAASLLVNHREVPAATTPGSFLRAINRPCGQRTKHWGG